LICADSQVQSSLKSHTENEKQMEMENNNKKEEPVRQQRGFPAIHDGMGEMPTHRRLGRINDRAYGDWEAFLGVAGEKMGVDLLGIWFSSRSGWACSSETEDEAREREKNRQKLENRLQVLHTLRCLLGPLVESMILLDRLVWVREELALCIAGGSGGGHGYDVELVNLFDQATGSGRNVGIVIKPSSPTT
jgi:hypothetical protein